MQRRSPLLCLLLAAAFFLIASGPGGTAPKVPAAPVSSNIPAAAPAYRMSLVWMADAPTSHEFVFVLNDAVGFRSVAALKDDIANFPPESTLTWAPSDCRLGGEPLLSSPTEMADFTAFCAQHKVKLIVIPGG